MKIVFDPISERKKIEDSLEKIINKIELNDGDIFVVKIYLENNTTNKNTQGIIINEIFSSNKASLIKCLISVYIKRGKAIWFSKLRLNYNPEITNEQEIMNRRKIYGNNIIIYTKSEKMFMGFPNNCHILFGKPESTQMYNLDNILESFREIL